MKILPVIISGGSGTRLWPLSRQLFPKQFLPLISDSTMFQDTITRLHSTKTMEIADPIIVCNAEHRFLVAEQLQEMNIKHNGILLEPEGRNTAPAIAAAALHAAKIEDNEDTLILILPADHVISNETALTAAIETAAEAALDGDLVTFGIVPTQAHTGYGYIKKSDHKGSSGSSEVQDFVEKPDLATAEKYFASHDYLWNAGMFLFKASVYLNSLERFSPEIVSACKKSMSKAVEDLDFIRLDSTAFAQSPAISVDYALVEKAVKSDLKVSVIPLDAGWNDVGSWESLHEASTQCVDSNAVHGDIMAVDTKNSLLHCEHGLLATVGVENLIVVRTSDAVLVADKSKSQDVKTIVERLRAENRPEPVLHRKVRRPWGTYDCVDESDNFQVKRIVVKPGAKLSIQSHKYRAEHWVVVKGIATVIRGDETLTLEANQSTYIPIGMKHSLQNHHDVPLEIIEVQSGSYLGEDDIIRYEDEYGRS